MCFLLSPVSCNVFLKFRFMFEGFFSARPNHMWLDLRIGDIGGSGYSCSKENLTFTWNVAVPGRSTRTKCHDGAMIGPGRIFLQLRSFRASCIAFLCSHTAAFQADVTFSSAETYSTKGFPPKSDRLTPGQSVYVWGSRAIGGQGEVDVWSLLERERGRKERVQVYEAKSACSRMTE